MVATLSKQDSNPNHAHLLPLTPTWALLRRVWGISTCHRDSVTQAHLGDHNHSERSTASAKSSQPTTIHDKPFLATMGPSLHSTRHSDPAVGVREKVTSQRQGSAETLISAQLFKCSTLRKQPPSVSRTASDKQSGQRQWK
jgi:hypothetical protein